MKKQLLNILLIFFLLFGLLSSMFISPVAVASDWIIDGDTVYISDENVYLSATPHTIIQDTWVTFKLRSKEYEGDIDACWLFDTTNCKPKKPVYYKVGNGDWEILTKEFTVENIDYESMTKAYLLKNINIQKDVNYSLKCFVDIKFNTTGKYWWGVKPSALGWNKGYYMDPWWDSAWLKRLNVRIECDYVPATVSNVPILFNISKEITENCSSNGEDIRFLADDNTTEYYYEFDRGWNSGSYNLVWVNITSISGTADTYLNIYYNNTVATDNQNNNTWHSEFVGVYHMNEPSGASMDDNTSNNNDGTYNDSMPNMNTSGKIGYGQFFDGTGDWVGLPAGCQLLGEGTVLMWAKAKDGAERMYHIQRSDADDYLYFRQQSATYDSYGFVDGGAGWTNANKGSVVSNAWSWIGHKWDDTNHQIIQNTSAYTVNVANPPDKTFTDIVIGASEVGTVEYYGQLDELWILTENKSRAWLNTTFHAMNQTPGFLTFGPAEAQPLFSATNTTTGIEGTNATLHGYILGLGTGNYNYGFWIGTTNPVTEANADRNMTGIGTITITGNSDFSHNDANLSKGTHYYVKSWATNATYFTSSTNQDDFWTKCDVPTGFTATLDGCNVDLAWTKGAGAVNTVVIRKVDAYPTWPTDGTEVYNNTGTSYSDTTAGGSHQYYRAWSWAGDNLSDDYVSANLAVPPCPPTSITGTILGNSTLRISWTKGTGAATTMVRKKVGSFPSSVTDGTQMCNSTVTQVVETDLTEGWYFRLWSYANNSYSSSVDPVFGALIVSCYDEETNGSLSFDVFVSNQSGSQTYESRNNTNPLIINVADNLPIDDKVSIRVSPAQSYGEKTETFTGYIGTENRTVTYVILLQEPESKALTSVTCTNITTWDNSYPAFTLVEDVITILADAADEFHRIVVNYTHHEYESRTYYRDLTTNHIFVLNAYLPSADDKILCRITVIDEASRVVDDAYMEIKRGIEGNWVTIASRYTDGNGQVDVFLVDGVLYKFVISKTGFITGYSDWTPSETAPTHTFKLYFEEIEPKPPVTEPSDIIFTAERTGSNLYINYNDTLLATYNTTVYVYGHNTSNMTTYFFTSWTNESVNSFTVTLTVNSEDAYTIILYYNTSYFLHQSRTITIGGVQRTITVPSRIGDFLSVIIGYNPFGWGNFLIWLFLVVGCYYSDGKHAGEIMLLLGGIFLFLNIIIGFNTTLITVAGGVIPILFIFCGIIVMWRESQKKVIA